MSVVTTLNKGLNKLYKIIAILLVLFAVVLSALRLFLPYAQNYRTNLQSYLNETYHGNIIIGNLSTGWQKLGPTLVAKNVSLVNSELVNIFIEQIDFSIDFWGSIQARQLITSDFTLSGAKLYVDQASLVSDTNLGDNAIILRRLGDLFLKQVSRFSLRDSQFILHGAGRKQHTVVIDELAWLNESERHRATGEIIFDGISSNNVKLKLDINGSAFEQLSGQVYLSANNLDITPWLSQILPVKSSDNRTSINAQSWLTVEQGKAKRLQVALGENQINWRLQGKNHQLKLATGQLLFELNDNFQDFQVFSSPLSISLDDSRWQPVTVQASQQAQHRQFYASYADLASLTKLLPFFVDDKAQLAQLAQMAVQGQLADIYLHLAPEQMKLSAQLSDLNTRYSDNIPGIEHVSGHFLLAGEQAQFMLHAEDGQLDFGPLFNAPIGYQRIAAIVNGQFSSSAWQITTDDLQLNSTELKVTGQLRVAQQTQQPITMALVAQVQDADVSIAHHYYPQQLMGDNLVNYLNTSLQAGQITSANLLFNGALTDFPFTEQTGIFTVDAELIDAKFQFDTEWPAINGLNANLNFTNNSMLITATAGELSGLAVDNVTATIDDLAGQSILEISAELKAAMPEHVTQLMLESPLRDSVGATLTKVVIAQPIDGSFALSLPLDEPEQALAKGYVDFNNNRAHLLAPDMQFTNVNGRLRFANEQISTEQLSVHWQDLPLALTATTEQKAKHFQTDIAIDANWQDAQYHAFIPKPLLAYIHGALAWHGDLALFIPTDGAFSYQLTVTSELLETELNLPAPYGKKAEQRTKLLAKVNGQQQQSTIDATYGEQLKFFGVLAHAQPHFNRAHLLLGEQQMLLPMQGFHISADLAQAKVSDWQPLITDIISSVQQLPATANVSLLDTPEHIKGVVANVDLFGQQLHDVSFTVREQQPWWLLQLNAKELRSQLTFYPDITSQGIDVKADFIHLPAPTTVAEISATSALVAAPTDSPESPATVRIDNQALFREMPPLRVHCGSCQYGALNLGELNFELTRPDAQHIALPRLTAKRGKTTITADGVWQANEQGSSTQFKGNLKTKDVEHEIEQLGFASVVKESGATIDFALNWQDGPFDLALAKLNGDIVAQLSDGYLAEVSDKGARLFSVLSLQSLVRKLRLDFRDIFSDGMFYSQITGDFHLKDGVLYTDNTKMKGAAGDLAIKGNTQLSNGVLDYRMSYKPNLTSSLPVLAWIATLNPVSMIAGFALDEVLTSKVVSEFNFELTGDVNEPILKEVNRKNRNISVGSSTPPQFVDNTDKIEHKTEAVEPVSPEVPAINKPKPGDKIDG
jgi:uncharacterized protein (TIGR02099 family)